MPVEILRLAEAARRLGITTAEMVHLVHERKMGYVLVDGLARIPSDVLEEYRTMKPGGRVASPAGGSFSDQ